MGKRKQEMCYICHERQLSMHSHHVQMRSRTADRGLLVDLCGSCHTDIHTIAAARVAIQKGGKTKSATEWPYNRHPQEKRNAHVLIAELVVVMMTVDTSEMPKVTSFQIPVEINEGLKVLKQEMGFTNKTDTILFCCSVVLQHKGLIRKKR